MNKFPSIESSKTAEYATFAKRSGNRRKASRDRSKSSKRSNSNGREPLGILKNKKSE
jgi:hypothetical protein